MRTLIRWVGRTLCRLGHRLCPEPLDITTPDGVRVCVAEDLDTADVRVLVMAHMPDGSTVSFGLPHERAKQLHRSLREAAALALVMTK